MVAHDLDSTLLTAHGRKYALASRADMALWSLQRSPIATWRSPARFGSLSAREINATDADIVNLHWVTNGFLSIEEIGKITKPLVWSLYDMWAFCGTEHYGVDSKDARWREGYAKENRPHEETGLDIDRTAWERKRKLWHAAPVVPASTWLTRAAQDSALMRDWPITRIPHVIDTSDFTPTQSSATAPTIVFLSSAGIDDQRKGFDLLEQALPVVAQRIPGLRLSIVGPRQEDKLTAAGVPIDWIGTIDGNEALRAAYCSGDVVAVPSREDNMPLTAMEAQTCGRPVVAFKIGGLPDIVSHHETGYLAEPFDTDSLARGLIQAIEDSQHNNAWGRAARERALRTWSSEVVVSQYLEVYRQALA